MWQPIDLIWDDYRKHHDLGRLREDVLTDPWYTAPIDAENSLLMRAVECRDVEAVKVLMLLGESPHLPASGGFTFLHQAVDQAAEFEAGPDRDAALSILVALLEAGASPHCQGTDGTPLHRAAWAGSVDSARILLAYGADIEARTLVDGELTPLMCAGLAGEISMVRFLLDSGANRAVSSGYSLTDPPMTLRELIKKNNCRNVDKILEILSD